MLSARPLCPASAEPVASTSGRGAEPLGCSQRWLPSARAWRCWQPRGRTLVRPCLRSSAVGVNGSSSNGTGPQPPASSLEQRSVPTASTRFVAETLLPTEQGKFRLRGYRHTTDGGKTYTEPTAIINGRVEGAEGVPVRVHDACFTSEVLGSLKCDCKEQLALAMEYIQDNPPGMVIYLQQEGRGIGLANKIAAYALQEKGLDTVDANRALGLPDDCREYSSVKFILDELGVKSIRLMTNNPRKISEVSQLGIKVVGRIPCIVRAQKYNQGYLRAKQRRMDHLLGTDAEQLTGDEELDGSFCFYDHEGEPCSAGLPLEPTFPSLDEDGNVVIMDEQGNIVPNGLQRQDADA